MSTQDTLTDAKEILIKSAERLFAEKGMDAVSDREVARVAGQKNNSAVQYHFGDRKGLIHAILEYRMVPLNQKRHELLEELEARGDKSLRDLIQIIVEPFIPLLENPVHEGCYISLVSQLFQKEDAEVTTLSSSRNSALMKASVACRELLPDLSDEAFLARMNLMGLLLVHSFARWDKQRRDFPERWTHEYIKLQTDSLIDFIVGGLTQGDE